MTSLNYAGQFAVTEAKGNLLKLVHARVRTVRTAIGNS